MKVSLKTSPMLQEYFNYQKDANNKYGEKSVVFMEVGSFFEVYELDLENIKIGKTKEIGKILNLQVTKKNKSKQHSQKNAYMVGFPNHSVHKFISKLMEYNYTVITFIQTSTNKDNTKNRSIDKVYSPCTYINNINEFSNFFVCVYIEFNNKIKYAYITAIDFSTGESKLYTTFDTLNNKSKADNDIFRLIHSLNPKEILFNKTKDISKKDIVNTYQISEKLIHICEVNKEYKNISYQNEFLKKIFICKNISPIEYIELSKYPDLILSFVFLLQFVYDHDNTIINKIKKPKIILDSEHLVLNNDSIYQLNIINNNNNNNKYSSLFNLVDNTKTNIGKRLLKGRLLYPITDINILNKRYDMIEKMNNFDTKYIRNTLSNINDIEKFHRKIFLKELEPSDFYNLLSSYDNIEKLLNVSHNFITVKKTKERFSKFICECNSIFEIEKLKDFKFSNDCVSFFKKGINKKIDDIEKNIKYNQDKLQNISQKYSSETRINIKVDRNVNDGYFLICGSKYTDKIKNMYSNLYIVKLKSHSKISSDEINKFSENLLELEISRNTIIKQSFCDILFKIYSKNKKLHQKLIDIISELDIAQSSSYISKKFCYKRPTIIKKDYSFVKIKDIRHPIIERIIDEEYICNDIELGKDKKGLLIYGVNSSGKSSIIRSLGCNIVLAQAGLFVSAKEFQFSPYTLLLSKISCADNLFKGQSTFISEILEIKNMISRSNNNTMILADELCAGTEGLSATSLVSSTILHLCKVNSTFIFSTHLHSLIDISEIKNLSDIFIKHFSVEIKDNILSFNRKLKDGHGDSIYGLEIAKTLDIGSEFMKNAFKFRNSLEKKSNMILNTKKSKYNSLLYVHECHICKKQEKEVGSLHTHHINFQKDADENGIIKNKYFHKNKIHNLVVLCNDCHEKVHEEKICLNTDK